MASGLGFDSHACKGRSKRFSVLRIQYKSVAYKSLAALLTNALCEDGSVESGRKSTSSRHQTDDFFRAQIHVLGKAFSPSKECSVEATLPGV